MTSRKAFVPSFFLVLLASVVALSLSACGGGSGSQPVRGPDIPYIPPGNRAPVIEQAFANITLTLDGQTAQWESGDISAYFSDPDNDRLEYQAEGSSNARVVGVTFSQTGSLIVRAVDAGTATIEVTATDPDGLKVSQSFTVTVSGDGPDLVIQSASVSDDTLTPGEQFTLSVTVRNQGDSRSAATTLSSKRHAQRPIQTSDPTFDTGSVPSLDPSSTAPEWTTVWYAPSTPGTYHYGACVDAVSGESDTGNNCSGVRVTVSSGSSGGSGGGNGGSGGSPGGRVTLTWPCPFGNGGSITVGRSRVENDAEIRFRGNTCGNYWISTDGPGKPEYLDSFGLVFFHNDPIYGPPHISFDNYNRSGRTVIRQYTAYFCNKRDVRDSAFCYRGTEDFTTTFTVRWLSAE